MVQFQKRGRQLLEESERPKRVCKPDNIRPYPDIGRITYRQWHRHFAGAHAKGRRDPDGYQAEPPSREARPRS